MQLKLKENSFLPVITATKLIFSHNNCIYYLVKWNICIFRCPFPDCSGHGYCSNVDGSCICDKVLSPKLYQRVFVLCLQDWTDVACNVSLYQRHPDTFCSWHISNKDNATLLCNVNFGQVINILSYNLTNKLLLNEPRNLTSQQNITTECTARYEIILLTITIHAFSSGQINQAQLPLQQCQ